MGFEPTTPTLARLCSTPELRPLARLVAASDGYMAELIGDCNREKRPRGGLPAHFTGKAE